MDTLPSKSELVAAVLEVLQEQSSMKTSEINKAVIKKLQIPEHLLEIEDANCTGSEFSYRIRCAETKLQQDGKISNPKREVWKTQQ